MLNHIIIHGRVVRDPELRKTNAGKSVATFTVAVDRDSKKQDGTRETDFIDVVAWEKLGEFAKSYLPKGKECVIQGRLQSRKWQDKDGKNRVAWELLASKAEFCGSANDAQRPVSVQDFPVIPDDDSDIPF